MTETPVSLLIMLVTVTSSVMAFSNPSFAESSIFQPYLVARGRRLHTLVTGNLIHADVIHLAFNMVSFYFFAPALERLIGPTEFFIVYMGSMLIADVPSLVQHRNNYDYRTLGASGAVSGVIFSLILFYPTMRIGMFFLPPVIPAYVFGPLYLIYCYYASRHSNDNINHDAHLWGALGGVAVTLLTIPESLTMFARSMSWI